MRTETKKANYAFAFARAPLTSRRSKRFVAEWTGLEPATPGVTGRYSNQLNYRSDECDGGSSEGAALARGRILND